MKKIPMRHDDVHVLTRVLYADDQNALYKDSEFTKGVSSEELVDVFNKDVYVKCDKDGNEVTAKAVELVKEVIKAEIEGTAVTTPESGNGPAMVYVNTKLSTEEVKEIVVNAFSNSSNVQMGRFPSYYYVIGTGSEEDVQSIIVCVEYPDSVGGSVDKDTFSIIIYTEGNDPNSVYASRTCLFAYNVSQEHIDEYYSDSNSLNLQPSGWASNIEAAPYTPSLYQRPDGQIVIEMPENSTECGHDANHLLTKLFSSTPFVYAEDEINYTLIAGKDNEFHPVD